MNAVIGTIIENMKQIEIVFEPTIEAFKKDTKNTGDSKEITLTEFLESFFPITYSVKKGLIYNLEQNSQEIDCVIIAPNHPRLITPKRQVILAEGVYAAIEVKPDIATLTDDSEFHRALKQIQTVKLLKRKLPVLCTEGEVPIEFHSIPSVIFSKKSRNIIDTINYIKKCVKLKMMAPNELPDMVVSLDNGIIFHSLHIEKTLFNGWINEKSIIHKGEKYICIQTNNEVTLGVFILILLCFKGPEPIISDFILKEYIKQSFNSITYNIIEP